MLSDIGSLKHQVKRPRKPTWQVYIYRYFYIALNSLTDLSCDRIGKLLLQAGSWLGKRKKKLHMSDPFSQQNIISRVVQEHRTSLLELLLLEKKNKKWSIL